ncbi:MAG: undecaprenyl diphosphate synthase family protein [Patescibacteria group bacterium]
MSRRLSGFMLWWIGYAELYFTEKKFPDFKIPELDEALKWFDSISDKRNFGK